LGVVATYIDTPVIVSLSQLINSEFAKGYQAFWNTLVLARREIRGYKENPRHLVRVLKCSGSGQSTSLEGLDSTVLRLSFNQE